MSEKFSLETKTIWRFKDRGNYGSNKGDYPGNWSPYVPKNIILRYSKEGDVILDQFLGSGTTLMEAKLLGRVGIGCDINLNAINIAKERTNNTEGKGIVKILNEDARDLKSIDNESIDLICTHPPYADIIKYSEKNSRDISLLNIDGFLKSMNRAATECFRVLKKNKCCAVMMGDIRRKGNVIPLGFNIMNLFIKIGFILKEIIIKEQFNCSSTEYWEEISLKRNFYLLAHEYIFIFIKK